MKRKPHQARRSASGNPGLFGCILYSAKQSGNEMFSPQMQDHVSYPCAKKKADS